VTAVTHGSRVGRRAARGRQAPRRIIAHVLAAIRKWLDPREVRTVGATPDYRFSLANERTFLAWIRTGLALIGGGLAVAQLLPPFAVPHVREVLSIALMVLGGGCAVRALDRWARSERAMRLGQDLPPSRFPAFLALAVGLGAAVLVLIVLVGAVRG
jgi:putative membrane protein